MTASIHALKAKARRTPRDIWGDAVSAGAERVTETARRFVLGQMSEAEAMLDLRATVKALHMGAVAVAAGGQANVTAKDLRRLGPILRDEYKFLTRRLSSFTAYQEYLANGGDPAAYDGQAVSAAQVLATIGQYANRARGTFENHTVRLGIAAGMTEVKRVLSPGENCHASPHAKGCAEESARGWHDVKTFVPIGRCTCGSACNCRVMSRRPA